MAIAIFIACILRSPYCSEPLVVSSLLESYKLTNEQLAETVFPHVFAE